METYHFLMLLKIWRKMYLLLRSFAEKDDDKELENLGDFAATEGQV